MSYKSDEAWFMLLFRALIKAVDMKNEARIGLIGRGDNLSMGAGLVCTE